MLLISVGHVILEIRRYRTLKKLVADLHCFGFRRGIPFTMVANRWDPPFIATTFKLLEVPACILTESTNTILDFKCYCFPDAFIIFDHVGKLRVIFLRTFVNLAMLSLCSAFDFGSYSPRCVAAELSIYRDHFQVSRSILLHTF